jgi:hypothetical protein
VWLNKAMHTVQVFVLRLFVDSEQPDGLRGALRSVPDGETQPFADEQTLLALLRQMADCINLESGTRTLPDQKRK